MTIYFSMLKFFRKNNEAVNEYKKIYYSKKRIFWDMFLIIVFNIQSSKY